MEFKPQTEQEIAENKLWKKGEYAFDVVDAFDKTSKTSGKPMIELKLRISNEGRASRTITDYLLAETPEKLLHAATALDLAEKYKTGKLSASDFKGGRGRLKLGIERDRKQQYPDKNMVVDYVCGQSHTPSAGSVFSAFTQSR